ncbi:LysR family transcriptional regulator substrate-binding protein [Kitasatospora sp. NPDC018058]|uniref:LysR family transcriptional regulator substrate-binding protein n=1 Tax=Kitasatospora sp. NPDC018058 TaxID=3364025 RepID=UPI0037BFECB8
MVSRPDISGGSAPHFAAAGRKSSSASAPVGRELYGELRPAWSRITAAVVRAVDAGRGLTGLLHVAFNGPAAGQLLVGVTQKFRGRHPDCEVRIREARPPEVLSWLRGGEVDLALTCHPVRADDVVMGPVLVSEARMLAVPTGHPFARREALSVADLARATVLEIPEVLPDSVGEGGGSQRPPAGRPGSAGPAATTFNEALTLVGAGEGVFVVGGPRQEVLRPSRRRLCASHGRGAGRMRPGLARRRCHGPGPGLRRRGPGGGSGGVSPGRPRRGRYGVGPHRSRPAGRRSPHRRSVDPRG